MSDPVAFTIRLDQARHRAARHRMIDDGATFQAIFDHAVDLYLNGDLRPYDAATEDHDTDGE